MRNDPAGWFSRQEQEQIGAFLLFGLCVLLLIAAGLGEVLRRFAISYIGVGVLPNLLVITILSLVMIGISIIAAVIAYFRENAQLYLLPTIIVFVAGFAALFAQNVFWATALFGMTILWGGFVFADK